MMKWWVNEIKLQNLTLNLNEKLYLLLFAKRIRPKYFKNLWIVLIILCNNYNICEKNIAWVISVWMYTKVLMSHPFFSAKEPAEILEKLSLFSASYQLFLVLQNGPFSVLRRPKANLRSDVGQDRLSHLGLLYIERTYVNRVDIEKLIDGFSSKTGRSKFFFQAISRPKNFGDLFWI